MPKSDIKRLLDDAPRHGATLVLRGLKNNSFQETATLLKDLKDGAIEINPELFEKHKVDSVPTFIMIKNGKTKGVKGNVTLDFAVRKLKE